ncbi:MAG: hypothetical protein K0R77_820 [Chryseobacterium sp.]|jgi:hypothetical protein|uniref:PH domain-containing protein n=1 Tax=Chryseobacterium sp. TaxID=1871047 RepID=UPI00260CCD96|nr:PH domain-containing protein [Chryseobacterium sp.]MDF2551545.1 hypothetical protein [Chryseobacterium sp.]
MTLTPVTNGLPNDLTMQLMSNETVFYFSYITETGGCGGSEQKQNYWIGLTDKRVLYKTKIMEANSYIEKDGILPFEKISFLEVSEAKDSQGCSQSKGFQLRISTSGGTLIIPIPTKEKGYEIRQVYSELNQNG